MRHHMIISGTGRAGTSFLVEFLTYLGLDTGFNPDNVTCLKDQRGRAGLEKNVLDEHAPYIVKNPWFCDSIGDILACNHITIDHVFIPVRDLHAAAESRRNVTSQGSNLGGLWYTDSLDVGDQEIVLLNQVYKLIYGLAASDVPVTLLKYPKLTEDTEYLFRKLQPLLPGIDYGFFEETFHRVVRPELVHSFNENDV